MYLSQFQRLKNLISEGSAMQKQCSWFILEYSRLYFWSMIPRQHQFFVAPLLQNFLVTFGNCLLWGGEPSQKTKPKPCFLCFRPIFKVNLAFSIPNTQFRSCPQLSLPTRLPMPYFQSLCNLQIYNSSEMHT